MLSPGTKRVQPVAPAREPGDGRSTLARRVGLPAGAVAFLLVLLAPPFALPPAAQRTAAVAALMAIWWMTEAIPLAATALLPLALFPVLGVLDPQQTAAPYANPVIFLFLGGFLIAQAMERWGLHRRVALGVVSAVGAGPRRLVLGFMAATAFISLWISNTATTAMMLPVALALAEVLRPPEPTAPFPFAKALMLGIAYAATIGGIGTLIGTPPNAVFAAAARELLGSEVSFVDWMAVGLPVVLVLLPLAWALLVFVLFPPGGLGAEAAALLRAPRAGWGPLRRGEALTLVVFTLTAAAWLLREPKDLGVFVVPGLTQLAPGVEDATIAIAGALLLFLLPVNWREGVFVLDWSAAKGLPWGVLLLFGGGLSLARAFESSGLTAEVGQALAALSGVPGWMLLGVTVAALIFLSELASNTAVAAMSMPVLAASAHGLGQEPLVFMAAGALASSTAFMLPVGTPPNALVFGSGYLGMRDMMRAGIWLNLASIAAVTLVAYLLAGRALG
ncbi:MAG: SLC13/DASS family transporter [Gemmatimonadetes bacterium]|nr:SLC13/DASS family transporter [Gemmatimonadota bacterium]